MHELGIAQEVVRIVDEEARRAGARRVLGVRVTAGGLMQVEPDTLRFLLDVVKRSFPLAAGAVFTLVIEPVRLGCRLCGHGWEMSGWRFACPACDARQVDTLSGEGIEVTDMEVDGDDERGRTA